MYLIEVKHTISMATRNLLCIHKHNTIEYLKLKKKTLFLFLLCPYFH